MAVLTLVNLADLVSIGFVGTPGNPSAVIVPGFVLAVIGTAATVPAWRGRRTGVPVMFWSRAISTVIALSYYLTGDRPGRVRTGLDVGILPSAAGLGLVAGWWRQRSPRAQAVATIDA